MKSVLGRSLSAAALVATMAVTAVPAEARPHWGRHHRHHGGSDDAAWAIGGGIIGLGLGALIASGGRSRGDRYRDDYRRDSYYDDYDGRGYYGGRYYRDRDYDRSYYDRGYDGRGYYGDYYAGSDCRSHRVYDPYLRRTVRVSYCD
ncbi:MAG TPA: hypothetical protein VJR87_08290 [Allosphingosinicella sp.]|nr:hypothetical protein [Allosphingosinicella sp.]